MDERLGKPHALAKPFRKFVDAVFPHRRDPAGPFEPIETFLEKRPLDPAGIADKGQVLVHPHVHIKRNIFRKITDEFADTERMFEDVITADRGHSPARTDESGENPHQR